MCNAVHYWCLKCFTGVKVLGRGATNLAEARALNHKVDTFDIYSNSWGPNDDGATMELIGALGAKAIEKGVTEVCFPKEYSCFQ